jgi:hypothetical protein
MVSRTVLALAVVLAVLAVAEGRFRLAMHHPCGQAAGGTLDCGGLIAAATLLHQARLEGIGIVIMRHVGVAECLSLFTWSQPVSTCADL